MRRNKTFLQLFKERRHEYMERMKNGQEERQREIVVEQAGAGGLHDDSSSGDPAKGQGQQVVTPPEEPGRALPKVVKHDKVKVTRKGKKRK